MAYDKNVFIFGAGASADDGAPVIKDFLRRARELYDNQNSGLNNDERKAFKDIFGWRGSIYPALRFLKIDVDNVEDLFSLIDMSRQLGDQEAEDMIYNLVKMISRTLELEVKFTFDPTKVVQSGGDINKHVKNRDIYANFLVSLRKWINQRDIAVTELDSFITLNYDTIFDRTLHSMKQNFTYCHSEWQSGMKPEGHKLLKLHGSVNWGICPECGHKGTKMEFFDYGQNTPGNRVISMNPSAKIYETICPKCSKDNMRPFIVPPTWNKASYGEELKPIWQAARDELAKAARIIIVGYSLPKTDSFFKYLLALGLSKNESLQEIILIDPASGDAGESLKQRYLEFIAPFFDANNFTFWNVPFFVGTKALEYRFVQGYPWSSDEAIQEAKKFYKY